MWSHLRARQIQRRLRAILSELEGWGGEAGFRARLAVDTAVSAVNTLEISEEKNPQEV